MDLSKVNPNCLVWRVCYTFNGNDVDHEDKFTSSDAEKYREDVERFGAETEMFQIRICDSDFWRK